MLLANVFLQVNVSDRWQWLPDVAGGYSVRSAYHLLTSQDPPLLHTFENLIWHFKVPVKVSILAWQLLRDRLPTKENLHGRDIITGLSTSCLDGCGQVETAQHLFLQCDVSSSLW